MWKRLRELWALADNMPEMRNQEAGRLVLTNRALRVCEVFAQQAAAQQSQISTLEARVADLERQLADFQRTY